MLTRPAWIPNWVPGAPSATPGTPPERACATDVATVPQTVIHDQWHQFIKLSIFATNALGAALLISAVALTAFNLCVLLLCTLVGVRGRLFCPLDGRLHGGELSLATIRIALGAIVCFALQLLVVADVLETMLEHPSFAMLGKLLLIVVIREGLAYVMTVEIAHVAHEVAHVAHGAHPIEGPPPSPDSASTLAVNQDHSSPALKSSRGSKKAKH